MLAGALVLAGCSLDRLGVTSVEIDLTPVPAASSPSAIAPGAWLAATGHVLASPASGTAEVTAERLPELSPGLEYRVWLGFASGPRSLLPGNEGEVAAAHAHGALRAAQASDPHGHGAGEVDAGASNGGSLAAVDAGRLIASPTEVGRFALSLQASMLAGRSLEALRATAVVLTATSTAVPAHHEGALFSAATILSGRAGSPGPWWDPLGGRSTERASDAGGGGHDGH